MSQITSEDEHVDIYFGCEEKGILFLCLAFSECFVEESDICFESLIRVVNCSENFTLVLRGDEQRIVKYY